LGQKDGRARDVLADDAYSDKPFFSEVIQSGGPRSNLNEYQETDKEGFPAGSGKSLRSSTIESTYTPPTQKNPAKMIYGRDTVKIHSLSLLWAVLICIPTK
jgi:hypothetical protein